MESDELDGTDAFYDAVESYFLEYLAAADSDVLNHACRTEESESYVEMALRCLRVGDLQGAASLLSDALDLAASSYAMDKASHDERKR